MSDLSEVSRGEVFRRSPEHLAMAPVGHYPNWNRNDSRSQNILSEGPSSDMRSSLKEFVARKKRSLERGVLPPGSTGFSRVSPPGVAPLSRQRSADFSNNNQAASFTRQKRIVEKYCLFQIIFISYGYKSQYWSVMTVFRKRTGDTQSCGRIKILS